MCVCVLFAIQAIVMMGVDVDSELQGRSRSCRSLGVVLPCYIDRSVVHGASLS